MTTSRLKVTFEKNEGNNQISKVCTNVAEIRFHKMLYNIQASEVS